MANRKHFIKLGQRFSRLIVIKEILIPANDGYTQRAMICKCDCGKKKIIALGNLFRTKSCGCLLKESTTSHSVTHGFSNDPIYQVLKNMKARCYDKKSIGYNIYGGRGITICDKWLNNRGSFYIWAYQNGYKKGLTIERKDNNKGYSPDNCTFINRLRQANNTRNNRIIEYNGEKMSMADFCRKYDLNYSNFSQRTGIHGYSIEKAMQNCGYYIPINKTEVRSIYMKIN